MAFFDFVTGRKTKFIVLLAWLLVVGALGAKAGQFEKVQTNTSESYLPGSAESLKALELERELPGGERLPGLVVFQRTGGLTAADRREIQKLNAEMKTRPLTDQAGPATVIFAEDGETATIAVAYTAKGEDEVLENNAERLRDLAERAPPGVQAYLTGGIGYGADAQEAFGSLNSTLLFGTAAIVILLLLLIYRSPVLWLLPIIAVGFAEMVSRAIGTIIAEGGTVVNGQAGGIMTVMVFGVGTDYALLLVSRYREELHRHEDTHEAMRYALHQSVPAITASAATVAASLFVLVLADNNGSQSLGPIAAIGVLVAMLSMLTALPALMLIAGRGAFYPFIPRFHDAEHFAATGFWSRLGESVRRRPRRVSALMILVMGVLALGWTSYSEGLGGNDIYTKEVDSVKGEALLSKSLPPGATAPTTLMVTGDLDDVAKVSKLVAADPGVAAVSDQIVSGEDLHRVQVTLKYDPYSDKAREVVPRLRDTVAQLEGLPVLVGGQTAIDFDSRKTSKRDNQLIIPVALVLVLLILIALLRAVLLPVVLMMTVIASYFATLGASLWVFENIFGFPGVDPSLPLYVFIFLVALGVDYNIFLMARAREETVKLGSNEGMMRALVATGGVITSAGLVLAGTFGILATLPLVFFAEIGFAVSFGVLFDALLVRSVLVPALVWLIGPRVWWPSVLAKRP